MPELSVSEVRPSNRPAFNTLYVDGRSFVALGRKAPARFLRMTIVWGILRHG